MSTTQQRVMSEGRTLGEAIRKAAEQLSVTPDRIGHEIDRAHFLSPTGRSQGANTVKIFAWSRAPIDSSGADAASVWLSGLIEKMGFEANIKVKMTGDKRADLAVSSPNGRHLVGRRGATLNAIQELMEVSVPAVQDGWAFRIDILGGDRDRDRDRDRDDRRGRDRRERRGRDRDEEGRGRRDGDDRRGRGRRDRDDRRGRGRDNRRRTPEDVDALRRLARKLGKRVLDTGASIVVRQELNSFERRIIHVTVGDMDGIDTESVVQDGVKRVKIMLVGGEE